MPKVIKAIPRYAKAVAGAVATLGTAVGYALADDTVTSGEWIGIAVAVLGAAGLVGAIPNKAPEEPLARRYR